MPELQKSGEGVMEKDAQCPGKCGLQCYSYSFWPFLMTARIGICDGKWKESCQFADFVCLYRFQIQSVLLQNLNQAGIQGFICLATEYSR